jgi:hypothetical protein
MSATLLTHVILLEVIIPMALGFCIMTGYEFPLHAVYYASELLHLSKYHYHLIGSTFSYLQSTRCVGLVNIQAIFVTNYCSLTEDYEADVFLEL